MCTIFITSLPGIKKESGSFYGPKSFVSLVVYFVTLSCSRRIEEHEETIKEIRRLFVRACTNSHCHQKCLQ